MNNRLYIQFCVRLLGLVALFSAMPAFAEIQTTLNLTVPALISGQSGTFSASQVSGPVGTNSGSYLYSYAGVTDFVQTAGTGRFATLNGATRYGIAFDTFQIFQSFLSSNYLTIVSNGTTCPATSTNYNWILARLRTPDAPREPMSTNYYGTTVGGTFAYNSSTSTFTGTAAFNLTGPSLFASPTYGVAGYSGATCSSGTFLGGTTGSTDLDPYMHIYMGANNFAMITNNGNPEVLIGAPVNTLSTTVMTGLSKYVFTGLYDYFTNATTQTKANVYLYPDVNGTTYTIRQATSLTDPTQYSLLGTLACTSLNTPANGFCSGTLTLQGVSGSGNAVCMVSPSTTENLLMCVAQYPASLANAVTIMGKTVNQAVMQVSVPATAASVASSGQTTTILATLQNLTSRYIPLIENPTTASQDLAAPWSNTGAFGGGNGTCGTNLYAFQSCNFNVTYTSPGIGTNTSVLRVEYNNGVATPNATANLVGVTGLTSLALTPASAYEANGGTQQATATATYSNGSTQNVSSAVNWSSSNATAVGISSTGLASWLSNGVSTVTASLASQSASSTFTVVTPPVLTTISNYNFPSTFIFQNTNFSFDFNNIAGGTPGNDTNMTYACVYNQTYNGVFSPGTPCTSLPGTVSFNTSTGVFSWTPNSGAWGPYQFQVTGTLDGTFSASETFYIDVAPAYVTANLRGYWDAQFANFTTPYTAANASWQDLTGHGYTGTSSSTTDITWVGAGTSSSPYAAAFDGSGNINYGTALMSGQTQLMFNAWVKPTSATSLDTVIFGNSSDGTGNGFTVRQSKTTAGKLEFLAGVPGASSSYKTTILADNPIGYWRLDESSGTSAADSSTANHAGIYENSPTLGVTGAINNDTDTAITVNGSSSYVTTTFTYNNPETFSVEVWEKTSPGYASGGMIAGFGNAQTGGSSDYDRHLWMSNTGTISFGIYNSSTVVITSPNSYNDGYWHHLVGTFTSTSMVLYIDGASVASINPGTTAQNYTGYWRFGYDSMGSWTPAPSSAYFAGSLDEAAIYNTQLTATQVSNHYNAAVTSLCTSQTTFANNAWNYIAGIASNSNVYFYVNGRLECSGSSAGLTSPATAFVAGSTAANTKYWTGSLAELQIYTTTGATVGTAANVKTDFDVTADRYRTTPVGPIAYNGLVLNLDAANTVGGLLPYSNGCAAGTLTWPDLSPNLQMGTLTNFTSCGATAGWNGNGTTSNPYRLSFLGSQNDVVPFSDPVSGSDVYTFEAWIRTSSSGAIAGIGNAAYPSTPSTWDPSFYVDTSGLLHAGDYPAYVASTTAINDGNWHNIVTTSSGSLVQLYVDDALVASTSGAGENMTAYLQLGTSYTSGWPSGNGGWFPFTGDIAKYAIYNRVLSSAEITQECKALQGRFAGAVCH